MKNLVLAACVALVVGVAGSGEAKADHCRYGRSSGWGGGSAWSGSYYSPGFSISVGSRSYPHYSGSSYYGFGGGRSHSVWHDTSHYDYHPPQIYRHRNHYHVTPGHYDLHRTGHWDTHYHR